MYQDKAVIELRWSNVCDAIASMHKNNEQNFREIFLRNNQRRNNNHVIEKKYGIVVILSDTSVSHCLVEFLRKKKLLNAIV